MFTDISLPSLMPDEDNNFGGSQLRKETELRKADRTVRVNCYYIFQYFVRHGLISSVQFSSVSSSLYIC